ncbi:hypothetical protein JX265_000919 [Neoarthrinium moseri]|uniref:Uncharacterized protein n=2 Tax=Neoarthrinium moseri TaxID=1658444 RepID=A0A9P9WWQ4_9PEZI|nr:hypothetical protein JX265_000919 [Neoarthrinium moseri]
MAWDQLNTRGSHGYSPVLKAKQGCIPNTQSWVRIGAGTVTCAGPLKPPQAPVNGEDPYGVTLRLLITELLRLSREQLTVNNRD